MVIGRQPSNCCPSSGRLGTSASRSTSSRRRESSGSPSTLSNVPTRPPATRPAEAARRHAHPLGQRDARHAPAALREGQQRAPNLIVRRKPPALATTPSARERDRRGFVKSRIEPATAQRPASPARAGRTWSARASTGLGESQSGAPGAAVQPPSRDASNHHGGYTAAASTKPVQRCLGPTSAPPAGRHPAPAGSRRRGSRSSSLSIGSARSRARRSTRDPSPGRADLRCELRPQLAAPVSSRQRAPASRPWNAVSSSRRCP